MKKLISHTASLFHCNILYYFSIGELIYFHFLSWIISIFFRRIFFILLSHSSILHLMKNRMLIISKEEDILQLREELACLTKLWNFLTQLHIFPKRSTNVYNILFTPGKGSQILWNVKSLGWQYLNLVIEYN